MAWYISAFFAVVALCAVIYAVQAGKDLFSKKQTAQATVIRRYAEEFPLTVVTFRRDRKDLHLVFRLEDGRELDLLAYEQLYKQCPAGTKGTVTWRGSRAIGIE